MEYCAKSELHPACAGLGMLNGRWDSAQGFNPGLDNELERLESGARRCSGRWAEHSTNGRNLVPLAGTSLKHLTQGRKLSALG